MKCNLMVVLCFLSFQLAAQTTEKLDKENEEAQREVLKRREAMMRAYEKDPKRYMDSVRQVRLEIEHQEALKRLAAYESQNEYSKDTVIDLSHARLNELPGFVFEASNLKKLIIDHNSIRKLPRKLKKLMRLEEVVWSNNITVRRKSIGKSVSVRRLIFTDNQDSNLPQVKRLQNLEYLDLSGNKFEMIPIRALRKLDNLEELVIKQNPLEIGADKYHKLASVKVLKLNKCDIRRIDPSFYNISQLKELQLQENPIDSLPEGISKMKNLGKLSFYKCELESLPSDFFLMPSLTIVDLYYNNLKRLPNNIGNAVGMEVLFASHNELIEIPEEIGALDGLNELYLHNNKLAALPESLSELSQLQVLRINENLFQYFPKEILTLNQLTDLDIDDNLIEEIPPEIGDFEHLKLFTFDGNPINFTDPRNQDFLNALYSLQQQGTICKPSIDREFVNESGEKVELN